MSFSGNARPPRTPTPPQGETVAAYATYLEAQKAVDHLADKRVPGAAGDDRRHRPEDGRAGHRTPLLPARRARRASCPARGSASSSGSCSACSPRPGAQSPLVPAIFIGGAFGLLFAILTYSFSRGKRDFTSTSQIVASSYAVLCRQEQAHKARELLREIGGVQSGWPARPPTPITTTSPSDPSGAYPPAAGSQPWGSPTVPPVAPPGPPAPPPGPPSDQPGQPGPTTRLRAGRRPRPEALAERRFRVDLRGVRLCAVHLPQREALREQQCEVRVHVCLLCRGVPSQVVTPTGGPDRHLSRRAGPPSTPRRRRGRGAARPTGSRCRRR